MVFLPNPPVEDAACGEADKYLRLPREMQSLFHWGYAQKIILGILYICLWLFFSHAFLSRSFQRGILNKNPHLWANTVYLTVLLLQFFRFLKQIGVKEALLAFALYHR
jgi:hypothetical protein